MARNRKNEAENARAIALGFRNAYDRRIKQGLKIGLSKSQAAGHARVKAGELPVLAFKRVYVNVNPSGGFLERRIAEAARDHPEEAPALWLKYQQAQRQGFRKRTVAERKSDRTSGRYAPTAVEELLDDLRDLEDSDYDSYANAS